MVNMELLKEQNLWWVAKEKIEEDVNLEKLDRVKYVWNPEILRSFNMEKDIIYTLRGSRQVGKTTALKLLVKELLGKNQKENIFYFTCNNVDTFKELTGILDAYLDWVDNDGRKYIFVDEITFVKNWTRAIKHLADLGKLRNCTMILTGSNAHDLKYEVERMPGRRGEDPDLDKILFPLTFREYVQFLNPVIVSEFSDIDSVKKIYSSYNFYKKELRRYLDNFLLTGGFIQAINNFEANGKIEIDIYQQYLSWALGDLAKLGRREPYSRQIFEQVIRCMTTNIGFDTIAKKTSIDSHITVKDYLDIMESNFIIKILYQIDVNRRIAVPRRTKKIYFQDMFLFWVFFGYVFGLSDYFTGSKDRLNDSLLKSKIMENLIMSHLIRKENSVSWSSRIFFFRSANQTEVDFVVKEDKGMLLPIEVKYKEGVNSKDFLNLDKVNRHRAVIISKEDFFIDKDKWIIPPEVFLIIC